MYVNIALLKKMKVPKGGFCENAIEEIKSFKQTVLNLKTPFPI